MTGAVLDRRMETITSTENPVCCLPGTELQGAPDIAAGATKHVQRSFKRRLELESCTSHLRLVGSGGGGARATQCFFKRPRRSRGTLEV